MISYLSDCEEASLQSYQVCIVGSGAAGISLAVKLSLAGRRVLLVETGDWSETPALNAFYAGQAAHPHSATTEYRRQRFGGTTHLWGGRCVPLEPIDFADRPLISPHGWPIGYEDIAAFYPEAMSYCDAGQADFAVAALAGSEAPMFEELPLLAPDLVEQIERYSLPTDFAKKYKLHLAQSPDVQVLLRARCTRLIATADGTRITAVELSHDKRKVKVTAGQYVLCSGGIETTRLLLNAMEDIPPWKRMSSSLGRYYGCHYDVIFGELRINGKKPFFGFQKTRDGVYARRKLQFSPQVQQEDGLLNSAFRLHFPPYADPSHGSGILSTIFLAKSILPSEHQSILNHGGSKVAAPNRLAHLRNVIGDLPAVAGFGWDYIFKLKLAKRKLPYTLVNNRNGSYPIEFNSEQVPDAENRIELTHDRDSNGLRRVAIHWKLNDLDIRSGVAAFKRLQKQMSTTRFCRLSFDETALEECVAEAPPIGGHHMGTTRMSASEKTGVVDGNCQVHGVSNLFVASSSVFPTNGHANPTLTIVALALRLADFLNGKANVRRRA
ncbi:MAG: GMC family oxidoreductase [Hyphomicrobiaceae bacterium]|nr:GMC family oxidoreductase [Hyphomicrobiaceae bacterium]